jgi:hypothetical protein
VTGRDVLAAAAWQCRAQAVWPVAGLVLNVELRGELLELFLRQAEVGIARSNLIAETKKPPK